MRRKERGWEAVAWILALGVLVFFGAWARPGLQPDAALYAGLAAKVLKTGEAWRLSGTEGGYFPLFFEHPPYFFRWGARVLAVLGGSDGAARAIGGIPGLLGFFTLVFWVRLRFSVGTALWTAFLLATFGHYTKFASSSMLEAPLALGTVLAAIGVYEILRASDPDADERAPKILGAIWLAAGLMIATAAKGVAGFGAMGGAWLAFGLAFLLDRNRTRGGWLSTIGWSALALAAAALPLVYWTWRMANLEGLDWIGRYWVEQVAHSAGSTRGDPTHAQGGSPLFYFRIILTNGWPWWWTVPACAWCAKQGIFRDRELDRWTLVAFSFWIAFFVPFSLVSFQLAHYIHPTYLVMAPLGGYFMNFAMDRFTSSLGGLRKLAEHAPTVRWGALALAAGTLFAIVARGPSFANRGQEFASLAPLVRALPEDCPVVLVSTEMAPYRLEAYAMWYWSAHPWRIVGRESADKPARHALWVPDSNPPRFEDRCQGGTP